MKGDKRGKCSQCGSEIEYGNSKLVGEQVYREWVCTECSTKGTEWYILIFDGHTIRV